MTARIQGAVGKLVPKSQETGNLVGVQMVMMHLSAALNGFHLSNCIPGSSALLHLKQSLKTLAVKIKVRDKVITSEEAMVNLL